VQAFAQRLLNGRAPCCIHVGPAADLPGLQAIAEGALRQ